MKAVGYNSVCKITDPETLIDFEAEEPTVGPNDLLVQVKGISVNPVDTKVRSRMTPDKKPGILGYDAAGIVKQTGKNVKDYNIGDEVFYAGDITRPGTNAELHAVDERIVGKKPKSLSFAEAAGLPLTSITAWEILFDSLAINEGDGKGEHILIIGGAGGVGSILIQLAKKLTNLTVIATASRPETTEWVKKMGVDHVIDHHKSLSDQIKTLNIEPRYVVSLNKTEQHFASIVELIKPRGHIALIDDPQNLDINSIKPKALSFSWEFMFTRSMFNTDDINRQQELLNIESAMIDRGVLKSTVTKNLGKINAETLIKAHIIQESGTVIGKNVLDGY
jgi:zinc-binding alcohol dehydrogenase family protein